VGSITIAMYTLIGFWAVGGAFMCSINVTKARAATEVSLVTRRWMGSVNQHQHGGSAKRDAEEADSTGHIEL
jgi:hypothetical protein